jgi:hypothetical protein
MGVDLRMEPYAGMFEEGQRKLRIVDEFCFPDIDKLLAHLGLKWDDYSVDAVDGRLPHDTVLRLLDAVELHQALAEKLLALLHCYRDWYEHPDGIPAQMQQPQFVVSVPGMAGKIRSYFDEHPGEHPWLVLS